MVAISLYRGNLHRVPDVPRRWLMPRPSISLKVFKSLLNRRSEALSRLCSSSTTSIAIAITSNSNPNPKPNSNHIQKVEEVSQLEEEKNKVVNPEEEGTSKGGGREVSEVPPSEEVKDQAGLDGGDCSVKPVGDVINSLTSEKNAPAAAEKGEGVETVDGGGDLPVEKPDELAKPNTETTIKADELNEREKRKKEVEEKLQVLNAKKHNLVQVLKQILNAEEELKRRSTMQGMAIRPPASLQVDVSNDSGSMTRQITPRMGSEAHNGGDMEGGEAEDVSNHNIHPRHIHRMSSTSPSSESPLRRPPFMQHNVVPHPSRPSGSPSIFAPAGYQGHPASLPAVSVSGTNYVASSPSPAASGGTSAFRDARQPSPWN